jgi:CDP-glucose 4,6-dehydratase
LGIGEGSLEDVMSRGFWRGKRVFLTGHTGFKGGWLALWLADMGAEVHGYALEAPTRPSFFEACKLQAGLRSSTIADIRDATALTQAMRAARPEIVFHLAAQSLVRYSYDAPIETYAVNVMGTVHLLEAVRQTPGTRAVVNVTTDKCYENREWVWPYRENEPMGGYDPYSSSKACSELVTAAYRRSFLEPKQIHLGSARAGNVIGGGDWAADRLIPDFLRSLDAGRPLTIRSPGAIRPWQHVLEPVSGYLTLAEKLYSDGREFAESWNFGPGETDARSVQWIVEHLCSQVAGTSWQCDSAPQPHEANYLKLDISKAKAKLGWQPRWGLQTALGQTLAWHRQWKRGADMAATSLAQVREYEACGPT